MDPRLVIALIIVGVILVILIGLNAFFAASEIAFISLNDNKIDKQANEGNKKAKQIAKMMAKKFTLALVVIVIQRLFLRLVIQRLLISQ